MSKKLVNISAVTDSSTLEQTFFVASQIDTASKAIAGLKSGIYSRIRREARNVYEEHFKRANGIVADLNHDAMRAQFKAAMEAVETGDAAQAKTWTQNKINFARALGLGFNFVESPEVASNAMNEWCKAEDKRIEDEKDAEAAAAYRKQHGLKAAKDTIVAGGEQKPAEGAPAQSESYVQGITFKDAEQEAAFTKVLQLMAEISAVNPAELDGVINGAVVQLTAKSQKVLKSVMMKKAS